MPIDEAVKTEAPARRFASAKDIGGAVPGAGAGRGRAGLTPRGGGGTRGRNTTACPTAGVCADEPFDVTPYGEALTRFFLRNPICQALPRKFKIALSGCPTDCAMGAMHDIGVIARIREVDGRREIGFRIVIGGGLSVSPQNAWVLHEFLPPERLLPVCEAIVRVFDRTGNRKNKGQARMKYAIRKLGFETFKAEIEKELFGLPGMRDPEAGRYVEDARPPRPEAPADLHTRIARSGVPSFRAWAATNTRPQRQRGYSMAFITLPRGDVTTEQFEAIAGIAETYGNGAVRTAQDQNILVRWVKSEELPAVHRALEAIGLGQGEAGRVVRPPASSPGAARNANGRAVPAYQMFLGGSVDGDGAHFGRRSAKIPARRVPEALTRLLALFRDERLPGESALAFYKRVDLERVNTVLADLTACSEADLRDDDFKDIGSDRPFEMEVGEGECAT